MQSVCYYFFLLSLLTDRVCIKMYVELECGKVWEFGSHTLILCGLICTPAVVRKQHWNGSIVKWCHTWWITWLTCYKEEGNCIKFLCYVNDEDLLWKDVDFLWYVEGLLLHEYIGNLVRFFFPSRLKDQFYC